jgi:hypothetical protein
MPYLIIGLLVFLAGCTIRPMTPRYANISGAEGAKPEHYEQTIREHLRVTLKDPYSIQDFSVSAPERTWCAIPSTRGGTFYGWRVISKYNAKNSYGAYVGLSQSVYWFHGESIKLITSDQNHCPEAW